MTTAERNLGFLLFVGTVIYAVTDISPKWILFVEVPGNSCAKAYLLAAIFGFTKDMLLLNTADDYFEWSYRIVRWFNFSVLLTASAGAIFYATKGHSSEPMWAMFGLFGYEVFAAPWLKENILAFQKRNRQ